MTWKKLIPQEVSDFYDVYNYNRAAEVLFQANPEDCAELMGVLSKFRITIEDLTKKGGNESTIPKIFSELLRPLGWKETRIQGDLIIRFFSSDQGKRVSKQASPSSEKMIENFIDGHNIDYLKNRVACDLEWNSKDQTFDRDLYAFRAYHECDVINVGIIITRSEKLNPVFSKLGIKGKYGASTTWIGKLQDRLKTGRHGGCPLLVFAITPKLIEDWKE